MYKNLYNKRTGLVLAAALATTFVSTATLAEVSGEVNITNDYRFRGISQTAGDFAVQGSLEWSTDSGLFAGAWASNLDFDEPAYIEDGELNEAYNGPNMELDLYVGYYGEITDDLSYDVTVYRYIYPGDSDWDYFDFTVAMDYMGIRAAYWYTYESEGGDLEAQYLELNYSYEFIDNWSLDLHGGYNYGQAIELKNDGFGTYFDYSIGISTEFYGVGISVAWLDTDIDDENGIERGVEETSGTVLANISYSF